MPLTIETAGALVSGAPLQATTRSIRVVRPFLVGGQVQEVGVLLTVPRAFAAELVAGGKAVLDETEAVAVQTPALVAAPVAAPVVAPVVAPVAAPVAAPVVAPVDAPVNESNSRRPLPTYPSVIAYDNLAELSSARSVQNRLL